MAKTARLVTTAVLMLVLTVFVSAPEPVGAAMRVVDQDGQEAFTILSLTPDPAKQTVDIVFSAPVDKKALRRAMRLLPWASVDWSGSRVFGENRLRLKGEFAFGRNYVVIVKPKTVINGRRYEPTVTGFQMPDSPPRAEFAGQGRVVERDGRQLIHTRLINVHRLKVETLSLPPLLLVPALAAQSNGDPAGMWAALTAEMTVAADAAAMTVRKLAENDPVWDGLEGQPRASARLYATGGELNRSSALSVPLSFRPRSGQGGLVLTRLTAIGKGQPGTGAPRLLRVTDIGLAAKTWPGGLMIWATSLNSGLPQSGVRLFGLTRDMNLFPLGVSNGDGLLTFTGAALAGLDAGKSDWSRTERRVEAGEFSHLLAVTGNDGTYLALDGPAVLRDDDRTGPEMADRESEGDRIDNRAAGDQDPRSMKAVVFTDRGVYRPGEKVVWKAVVRVLDGLKPAAPEDLHCQVEMISPRGETVVDRTVELSRFGTASGWYQVPESGEVGPYLIRLTYGLAEDRQTEMVFQVQEYRRPRHYVEISFDRFSRPDDSLVKGGGREMEMVRIKIDGLYYAGGPVARGRVRWRVSHSGVEHRVAGLDDYTFGSPGEDDQPIIEAGQTVLDDQGRATVDFPLDRLVTGGTAGLRVEAWVTDFDARVSSAVRTYSQAPDLLVGISRHPAEVRAAAGQRLSALVTDKQGRRIYFGWLRAEVLQQGSSYIRKLNEDGRVSWTWEPVWRRVFGAELGLSSGEAAFGFEFAWGGRYRILFTYTDQRGRSFTSATEYRVIGDGGWRSYDDQRTVIQKLGLTPDQTVYRPGQTARVMADRPPRTSAYLVSLERDSVLRAWVVRPGSDNRPPTLEMEVGEDWAPNVYLNVLAIAPRGEWPLHSGRFDDQAPDFHFGRIKLPVKIDGGEMKVGLGQGRGALAARPGQVMEMSITTTDDQGRPVEAELAVGVVDESVLALTGTTTPSLERLLLFSSPLAVVTAEERALLTRQTPFGRARNVPLTGGDGAAEGMRALAAPPGGGPIKVRADFNPVAYFNPQVVTGPDGRAAIRFTLPDSMTTYRIFAVACDTGSRFASRSRMLTVSKPFYVEPGLPRFFTLGDEFSFPVRAFNSTGRSGLVSVAVSAEGGLELNLTDPRVDLPDGGQAEVHVTGKAVSAGPAKVLVEGTLGPERDAVERFAPVTAGLPLTVRSWFGLWNGSTEIKPDLPPELMRADAATLASAGAKARLIVAASPLLRLVPAVERMLGYPYGCVEQTSSRMLALAGVWPLAGKLPGLDKDRIRAGMAAGVDRLLSLQTGQGGFGYWPGRWRSDPLGSGYAAMALLLARQTGAKVPVSALKSAMGYLDRLAKDSSDRVGPTARGLACYALAKGGGLKAASLNKAARDYDKQPRAARLLLALAAIEAGLIKSGEIQGLAQEALKPGSDDPPDRYLARYLAPAAALVLARKAGLPEETVSRATLDLVGGLGSDGMWSSTSDTGWAVWALAHGSDGEAPAKGEMAVTVVKPDGGLTTFSLTADAHRTIDLDPADLISGAAVRLSSTDPGRMAWLVEVDWPRTDVASAGLSRGLKLTREVVNTDGSDEIRVGDIVEVRLTIDATVPGKDAGRLDYIVIDDPLAAGLVAVNPVFKTEQPSDRQGATRREYAGLYWSPDGYYRFHPEHLEMRDRRVLAFRDTMWPGRFRFTYLARAVCAGKFVTPPARVQLMYRPEVEAYTPAATLRVLPTRSEAR